ncbi:MAG: peptidylprolyl isomerase [Pseudomonadota bacterium]
MKHARLLVLIPLIVVLAACGKSDSGKTVATVNGEVVTERDVDDLLQARGVPKDNAEARQKATELLTNRILLVQHAIDQKLDKDPAIDLRLKRMREELLIEAAIRKLREEKPVDDAAVRKAVEKNLAGLHKNEYRASHILVASEDEAKAVIAQLRRGAAFAALARQKSMDKGSGQHGGDIGWRQQGNTVPEFFNVLPDLKKGGMTGAPVKSQYGWHIIRLTDSRPLKLPTVDEFMNNPQARMGMTRQMQEEHVQALVKSLRDKAKIKTP